MESLKRDLRYALRTLLRSPGYTAVAVLTLALGLGATTAIYSVVDAVVLSPLPFEGSERLVALWEVRDGRRMPVSPGNFSDWRERAETLDSLALVDLVSFNLAAGDAPERLRGGKVSSDFFRVLRAEPELGRTFLPDEDRPGEGAVAVLGHDLWQRRFGGDDEVIGRRVLLDGVPYTVVGVMGERFEFPYLGDVQEIWVPRPVTPAERALSGRWFRSSGAIARLDPGVTIDRANEELGRIAADLAASYPEANAGWSVEAVSLQEQAVRGAGRNLFLLLGAVSVLLLVALANVASMSLARETVRQREVALRVALGAGRGALARQLVTESVVLALAGGAAGLALAALGVRLLALAPSSVPRLSEVAIDGRIALFAVALSIGAGIVLALTPILRLLRLRFYDALKAGGGRTGAGKGQEWARNLLLVAESALVLVLLVAGGLMIRGFVRLAQEDPGFEHRGRIAAEVLLPRERYPERHLVQSFFERVEDEVARAPGVAVAGVSSALPMVPTSAATLGFVHEGEPVDLSNVPSAGFEVVTPGYFEAAGVPLVRGRLIEPSDVADSAQVLVINETMARRFWPDEDPLGRRIQIRDPEGPWVEVVGIVGDVKHGGLGQEARPVMYQPLRQMAIDRTAFSVIAVAAGDAAPESLAGVLRRAVRQADADQAAEVKTLTAVIDASLARERFNLLLLNLFAGVALVLGAVGIFGVVSYTVSQRRRQIGIRMALGAQRRDVFRWITARALAPVAAGAALGVGLALSLSRLLASLIYEVSPTDPAVYAGIVCALLAVALAASFLPARRATRIDPLQALRDE